MRGTAADRRGRRRIAEVRWVASTHSPASGLPPQLARPTRAPVRARALPSGG